MSAGVEHIDPDLTPPKRDEVKKVTRQLLGRLKEILVLNWRQRVEARARVRSVIEDTLDTGLPRAFTPDIYRRKGSAVFRHIFESYQGPSESAYTHVA